ncbi:Nuclear pore complex protein NUP50A [Quillaja saponaria]|uniref:Nuclear pore complex protein NUP50A n=1 Tax=Quillaja saponaria TaxID=32244 RepID=A0AAD7L576_QUISA|nr:Nuclear pore complex protein NUP50A [Quillaja saponaria]
MADAENAVPPSKKRAAGREISRDNPGLDDDEDSPEQDTGTFKKASDEVLATRRIVKVRRQQTNSAPSSNPFAGIRLVAPTETSADTAEVTTEAHLAGEKVPDDVKDSGDKTKDAEKAKDEDSKQSEGKTDEAEDKSTGNKEDSLKKEDPANAAHKEDGADKETDKPSEANKPEADNEQTKDVDKTENLDNEENKVASGEHSAEGSSFNSFQQLSSSQNAFTGLAGSGFSSSTFSFGTIPRDGSSLGNGSSSIFGLKNDKPFGLALPNNGNSSLFGASGASTVSKSEGSGLPTMQEVTVETGEENERVVFTADSVLFEFIDGGWKERGKGELKVNVTTTGTDKARLLMRARGNYRLILNASLYSDMKLTNMDKKGVTFACINSASEGKDSLSTFALKFKDNSILEEFRATVMAHKATTSTVQKTPENSPKASGD